MAQGRVQLPQGTLVLAGLRVGGAEGSDHGGRMSGAKLKESWEWGWGQGQAAPQHTDLVRHRPSSSCIPVAPELLYQHSRDQINATVT